MTPQQEKNAEAFIEAIKLNGGSINFKEYLPFMPGNIDNMERLLIIRGLKDKKLLDDVLQQSSIVRLTESGWHFLGFEKERQQIANEVAMKEQIDHLTIRELKGNIFQLKYWWVFIFINIIVSLIIAWLTKEWN